MSCLDTQNSDRLLFSGGGQIYSEKGTDLFSEAQAIKAVQERERSVENKSVPFSDSGISKIDSDRFLACPIWGTLYVIADGRKG